MLAKLIFLSIVACAMSQLIYPEPIYPPQPYHFSYDSVNPLEGGHHYHEETSDETNSRTGSYGYTDAFGVYRRVDYVADAGGFRASVSTNEPGTAPSAPADAFYSNPALTAVPAS
ncbi:cuticle protein 10.9 [Rhipicephalus sanguineus]|uniref:cuticle protein 10.9 n=1 Tax=Rhipicephalus sanguineus TaxID=34632 RepID=UPI0018930FCD|nr:cuticle protein 10.9 [Rhipicephalus sanguineus]